ncbi:hypothetical protein L7F22_020010 [Adiantum nelumboides]|nr:hypothetical protein [Adiantum nelumboides]
MLSSTSNEKPTGISAPSTTIKEGSLSYYFNLHRESFFSPHDAPHSKHHIICTSSNLNFFPSYPNLAHATKRRSSSARTQSRPLLDGDEGGTVAPLSWLSTLFSRRKQPHNEGSRHACKEGKCEPFPTETLEWEPPRASSWEQLSSWEKPSSSEWNLFSTEPQRASDADVHELRRTIAAQAATDTDAHYKKQETSSNIGQLHWAKSLLTVKWAMKLRRRLSKKRVAEQGCGDGEGEERATKEPSPARDLEITNGQIKGEQERASLSQRELGATWSSHYSQSYGKVKCNNNKLRSRSAHHIRGEQGLLRFYLTPTRGIKTGSRRPRSHHRLISEI